MSFKELREKYRLTRQQLSELTSIPVRTIKSYELGERNPDNATLFMVEKILSAYVIPMPQKTVIVPATNIENDVKLNNILKKEFYSLTKEDISLINSFYINRLRYERDNKDKGGIYGYTQRKLAYNSSKIEGNRLTEDETRYLFELNQLPEGEYRKKDIEEMTGHFIMFNKMLNRIGNPLSEKEIKEMHCDLQSGVFEFIANGGIPGEYKHRANIVNDIITSSPEDVEKDIRELFAKYNNEWVNLYNDVSILSKLHSEYEKIHPFQDGNGRTGRCLIFREALRTNNIPFIISDAQKRTYYDALHKAQVSFDINDLNCFFEKMQVDFYSQLQYFLYDHSIELSSKDNDKDCDDYDDI